MSDALSTQAVPLEEKTKEQIKESKRLKTLSDRELCLQQFKKSYSVKTAIEKMRLQGQGISEKKCRTFYKSFVDVILRNQNESIIEYEREVKAQTETSLENQLAHLFDVQNDLNRIIQGMLQAKTEMTNMNGMFRQRRETAEEIVHTIKLLGELRLSPTLTEAMRLELETWASKEKFKMMKEQ